MMQRETTDTKFSVSITTLTDFSTILLVNCQFFKGASRSSTLISNFRPFIFVPFIVPEIFTKLKTNNSYIKPSFSFQTKTQTNKLFHLTNCSSKCSGGGGGVFSVIPPPPDLRTKLFILGRYLSFVCSLLIAKNVFSEYTGSSSYSLDWWGDNPLGEITEKDLCSSPRSVYIVENHCYTTDLIGNQFCGTGSQIIAHFVLFCYHPPPPPS